MNAKTLKIVCHLYKILNYANTNYVKYIVLTYQ